MTWLQVFPKLPLLFIVVKYTSYKMYHFNHFQMYNSVASSIFTMLYAAIPTTHSRTFWPWILQRIPHRGAGKLRKLIGSGPRRGAQEAGRTQVPSDYFRTILGKCLQHRDLKTQPGTCRSRGGRKESWEAEQDKGPGLRQRAHLQGYKITHRPSETEHH